MSLRIFCVGMMMGIADLIPRISGGSVAFFSGYYSTFLQSLQNLAPNVLLPFLQLRWKKAFCDPSFLFLFPLFAGAILSCFMFSQVLYYALLHPITKLYVYAFFLGLILKSCQETSREIKQWDLYKLVTVALGMAFVLFLLFVTKTPQPKNITDSNWLLTLTGFLAASAMILPGISGSYILLLFGFYPPLIYALSHPTEISSWIFLSYLSVGIIAGLVFSSRLVFLCMKRYRSYTFCALLGVVLGSVIVFFPKNHFFNGHGLGQILTIVLGFFVFHFFKKIAYKDQIFL